MTKYKIYKVEAALRSVVPFALTSNTYVKVKASPNSISLGSIFDQEPKEVSSDPIEHTS